jgi:BatD DUF11 like domain
MNRQSIIYTIILLILFFFNVYSQEASSKIDKLNYKLDEEINLVFIINQKFDSIKTFDLSDFKILEKPIESSSNTTINNKYEYEHKITCKISAKSPGKFKIIPPKYYFGNDEVTSDEITITIENDKLTDEENKAIVLKKMSIKPFKPEGTIRYTIIDGNGYIEEFKDKNWVFLRILTKKEVKRLKKK